MTREESIEYFKDMNECTYGNVEPIQMAIKALEKEPCEDCISRQAVLDMIENAQVITDGEFCGYCTEDIDINILPPVTPQQKIGHWVEEVDDYGEVMRWHCDKCYEDSGFATTCKWDYCPNCGCLMKGEGE